MLQLTIISAESISYNADIQQSNSTTGERNQLLLLELLYIDLKVKYDLMSL
jgi:hypothetical protein